MNDLKPVVDSALAEFASARTPAELEDAKARFLGKSGIVTVLHGSIDNPLDHRGIYPPLCSVLFPVRDVFGGASRDTLSVDVHEDWLAPAGA